MDHTSRHMKDNSAESTVDYGGPTQELSEENNIAEHFCYI